MKRTMLAVLVFAAITLTLADANKKGIIALTPQQVRWYTPSYYTDGRERAQLLGDSSQGGAWIDRVKIPAGKRVLAHTHQQGRTSHRHRRNLLSGRGNEIHLHKAERVARGQFHRYSGWRTSFCCDEGPYRDRFAQRPWQISHGLC